MKFVVIGSTGQLGTDLITVLSMNHDVVGLAHNDIEITDYDSCTVLKKYQPDAIINTAAFHKTDQCEDEPQKTFCVNALGARNIATISNEINATDIYISTDYVFDGANKEPYAENDVPSPINTYGISKLAAEQFTKQNPKHYIIRIASVFGIAGASGKGGNFVEAMVKKAKNNETITVIDDMIMSPTYTKDASNHLPYGVYHATNRGYCSWYEFAKEIFQQAGLASDLRPIKTKQLTVKAKRPMFSALKSIQLPKYGIVVATWQEALHKYLIEKGYGKK
jgi:dTDP-4-dehydrorhamnose reductase